MVANSTRKTIAALAHVHNKNLLYHKCGGKARNYLRKRGIDIKRFGEDSRFLLGTPDGNNDIKILKRHGIDRKPLANMGLLNLHNGRQYFERGRITFPVFHDKQCVHMTSRSMFNDNKMPHKHMNRNIWYMYNGDAMTSREHRTMYIVEGPLDCLSMVQMGMPNTVATYGVGGLRKSVLEHIDRKTTIYFAYDNDVNESGLKGAYKNAWQMLEWGYDDVYIIQLARTRNETKTDCNSILVRHRPKTSEEFWKYTEILTKYAFTEDFEKRAERKARKNFRKIAEMYDEQPYVHNEKNILNDIPITIVIKELANIEIQNYSARCPLPGHNDNNPSFHIFPETNTYFCYGCQRGGDVIAFVMDYTQCNFRKAIETLKTMAKEDLKCQKN